MTYIQFPLSFIEDVWQLCLKCMTLVMLKTVIVANEYITNSKWYMKESMQYLIGNLYLTAVIKIQLLSLYAAPITDSRIRIDSQKG